MYYTLPFKKNTQINLPNLRGFQDTLVNEEWILIHSYLLKHKLARISPPEDFYYWSLILMWNVLEGNKHSLCIRRKKNCINCVVNNPPTCFGWLDFNMLMTSLEDCCLTVSVTVNCCLFMPRFFSRLQNKAIQNTSAY